MDAELKKALDDIKGRLDAYDGILEDYHRLLTNHITDYSTKFGRLKAGIEEHMKDETEKNELRDKALHVKIDAYKWGLILVATFTVALLGGFVYLVFRIMEQWGG